MFGALGRSVSRHPYRAIVIWLIIAGFAVAGAFWGFGHGGLFSRVENSASLVPGSESDQVNDISSENSEGTVVTIVVSGLDMETDAMGVMGALGGFREDFSSVDGVTSVVDPFMAGAPVGPESLALMSDKSDGFVILVTLDEDLNEDDRRETEDEIVSIGRDLEQELRRDYADASCDAMYMDSFGDAINAQIQEDLVRGEIVGLPVALILLIIVFGGFVAAGLPILGAIVSIGVGMGGLWALTFSTTVESFILNVVTVVGLALSIDYGLLVVSRYREELATTLRKFGYPADGTRVPRKFASREIVTEAVEATIKTAGRTVFFSALTIAMALLALVVMKADILRIIAAGGMIVTLLAVLMAITLVPSMIVILNRAMVKPSIITRIPGIRSVVKAVGDTASDKGFFSRLARGVHKHPWIIMTIAFLILAGLALPLKDLQVRTALTDYMPEGEEVTTAYETLKADYPALRDSTIIIVAEADVDEVGNLMEHIEEFDDVGYVSAPVEARSDSTKTMITVYMDLENQVGKEVTAAVRDLRGYDPGYTILIGGGAALQLDFVESIIDGAPLALSIMIMAVFILLFLMTGSLVVPLKALLINSLSLLASLGVTTFIFQNGLFGMPEVMGMETFIIACSVCFGFGLAMDYEVFLIARIKEAWDHGHSNDESVERGLQRSGRIITSAAAIIVAVFFGFTAGEMVAIKEIGVALAATVIVDATLVRMLLVPATMTVLGKWNWWAPKPLRWLHKRLYLSEAGDESDDSPPPTETDTPVEAREAVLVDQ